MLARLTRQAGEHRAERPGAASDHLDPSSPQGKSDQIFSSVEQTNPASRKVNAPR
jgi:hypothetical protein